MKAGSYLFILMVFLTSSAQAQFVSPSLITKFFTRDAIKKSPPKYLCAEAGYGDEIGVKLVGETNALVVNVESYVKSSSCYDYYNVRRGKSKFQVRVFLDTAICNWGKGGARGRDGETAEQPITTSLDSFTEGQRIPRHITFSSQVYDYSDIVKDGGRKTVSFYRAYLLNDRLKNYTASNRLDEHLGTISKSCGPYALIGRQLYEIRRLEQLQAGPQVKP